MNWRRRCAEWIRIGPPWEEIDAPRGARKLSSSLSVEKRLSAAGQWQRLAVLPRQRSPFAGGLDRIVRHRRLQLAAGASRAAAQTVEPPLAAPPPLAAGTDRAPDDGRS